MRTDKSAWYAVANAEEVNSPGLLIYPDRVQENIRRMIQIAGRTDLLRPHVKTHKLAELVRLQLAHGITQFKAATIAEAEMVAAAGGKDVLLAYQPVGPNVRRVLVLTQTFPGTRFAVLVDDAGALQSLSDTFARTRHALDILVDIDCGMHRTGVMPDQAALDLYTVAVQLPGVRPTGLHAYDGHLHDADPAVRKERCDQALAPVLELRSKLAQIYGQMPALVAGGTPTYPIHAKRPNVECSPGTCLLWDAGYAAKLPDLDFLPAALVLTRVVSKPGPNRLCLDLGHKAIAAENPPPRVQLFGLADAKAVMHSEEHLVIETPQASQWGIGDCIYGVPWHICPTVALHSEAVVVKEGRAEARWRIAARERTLTV